MGHLNIFVQGDSRNFTKLSILQHTPSIKFRFFPEKFDTREKQRLYRFMEFIHAKIKYVFKVFFLKKNL